MGKAFINYRIEERSFVSYIKREIHLEVTKAAFKPKQVAEIDLIVSEITSNLIKHAGSGEVLYRTTQSGDDAVFEIVCIDKGPGMSDPARMMKDGVSTTGTLGQGLGAIERLSDFSQVYSILGWGTIVYSVVATNERKYTPKSGPDLEVRAVCLNKPRETTCGDGYRVIKTDNEVRIFFADGLGHGEHAKAAVDSAAECFMASNESDPAEIIRQMHDKVRRTRGLVMALAIFDKKAMIWKICGVGNILIRLFTGLHFKSYMSFNGTVGLNIPNSLKSSVLPVEKNQHLIMCSDGIRSRWTLNQYPTIFKFDNTILAAALYTDFARGNDDASVLIAKVIQT
ncbi:MAG: ATP-binding protein [Chryseosolibacter sp.]